MVLDNQPARLQVGNVVPYLSQTAQSTMVSNAPVINSINYQQTGVVLDVTPRVNSGGLVTLDISQEVSDVHRQRHHARPQLAHVLRSQHQFPRRGAGWADHWAGRADQRQHEHRQSGHSVAQGHPAAGLRSPATRTTRASAPSC